MSSDGQLGDDEACELHSVGSATFQRVCQTLSE